MSRRNRPVFDSDDVSKFAIQSVKHPSADRSFLCCETGDADKWARETRAWVKELLHYAPPETPLDVQVEDETEFDEYIRKKVYYTVAPYRKGAAYLLIPKNLHAPAPAIVALHCHSGKFYYGKEKLVEHPQADSYLDWMQEWRYGGRGVASELAKRGYIVVVPDLLGWGELGLFRESWLMPDLSELLVYEKGSPQYILRYDKLAQESFERLSHVILYSGSTYVGVMLHSDMRSVDLLFSMPQVDKERIGCLGLSMGGLRTVWMMAMDERIKCGCPVGFTQSYQDMVPHLHPNRQSGLWQIVPGLNDHLPFPDLTSLAIPRKLLVLYCENDKLFEMSVMKRVADRTALAYKKAGLDGCYESKGFPVGHQFDYDMQEYAFDWFDKFL